MKFKVIILSRKLKKKNDFTQIIKGRPCSSASKITLHQTDFCCN